MIQVEDDEERAVLKKFEARLEDLAKDDLLDDVIMLRFLRARNHDVVKAEEMLRKTLQWREEKNIEMYYTWKAPEEISTQCIFRLCGYDNDGRPVIWLPMGRWPGRELIEKGYKEELIKYSYHMFQSIAQHVKESKADQANVIFGVEELTMWKIANMEAMQTLYGVLQDLVNNYPEGIKYIHIVNAPWIFSLVFNFIRPILTARSLSKIQVYNSDKTKWIPILLEKIPRESLPTEYLE